MKKKIILIVAAISFSLIILTGCAKFHHPTYSGYVGSSDFNKYRKIAILPFADAPNKPQSGLIVQGLACNVFSQFGFHVAERAQLSALLSEQKLSSSGLTEEIITVGRLLGVNAMVVGEVAQYDTIMMSGALEGTLPIKSLTGQGAQVFTDSFTKSYEASRPKSWIENYVAVSLRIIDIETGAIIYAGSAQYDRGYRNPPQTLADRLLKYIVMAWLNPKHVEEARQNRERISIKQLKVFEDFEPKIK